MKTNIKRTKGLFGDEEAVSTIVASLMLIIVVAVSAVAISYTMRDLGLQTSDVLGKGSVADAASIKIEIVGTENTSNVTDNLVKEYNKEQDGVIAKSYTSTLNLTSGGILNSIDEKIVEIGIIDKDVNVSTPDLDSYYNLNYYPIGVVNLTNTTDPSATVNITRIYIISRIGTSILTKNFIDWIHSPEGQQVINNSGYISHLQEINGVKV